VAVEIDSSIWREEFKIEIVSSIWREVSLPLAGRLCSCEADDVNIGRKMITQISPRRAEAKPIFLSFTTTTTYHYQLRYH